MQAHHRRGWQAGSPGAVTAWRSTYVPSTTPKTRRPARNRAREG